MSKMLWVFGLAMLVGVAQPALACRGPFSHRYVFLETPPARLPNGAVLLTVTVDRGAIVGGMGEVRPVAARIISAKNKKLVGKTIVVRPDIFSSCHHWAESERAKFVVGFLKRQAGRFTLVPVVYRSNEYRTSAEDNSVGVESPASRKVK